MSSLLLRQAFPQVWPVNTALLIRTMIIAGRVGRYVDDEGIEVRLFRLAGRADPIAEARAASLLDLQRLACEIGGRGALPNDLTD